ncbi:MAG: 4-hydroxy-3-methylbut-2-enyl diphosphate reductase [Lentisphaerae bacterium GWF2_49_21]|nr:MAG: 4-hydroxy-3-methylbut-2-enyl diphosphate reductase [Lentisphaerae bacterium GWF2_49_21]
MKHKGGKKIIIAVPHGFCAGVRRALETVEKALELYGKPVYVRHEIVHNKYVVDSLREKGVVFLESSSKLPKKAHLVFSAHGVPPEVEDDVARKGYDIIDATCPLVKKIHLQAVSYSSKGYTIIIVGHKKHPEVVGTAGQVDECHIVESLKDVEKLPEIKNKRIACLTQTTLSADDTREIICAIKKRFRGRKIAVLNDICYATQNRQNAVKALAKKCDAVFIIGSENSSNANRLREVAEKTGAKAYLISGEKGAPPNTLRGLKKIGISAGASTPEILISKFISFLNKKGWHDIETIGSEEKKIVFRLPERFEN